MMFTAGLIFLVGFWVGFPLPLRRFEDSPIARAFIPCSWSTWKLHEAPRPQGRWKTVATAILALILLSAAIYLIGSRSSARTRRHRGRAISAASYRP
jgi:hypothetical protein